MKCIMFYESKVNEELHEFLVEIYKIVYDMEVTSNKKVEPVVYKL